MFTTSLKSVPDKRRSMRAGTFSVGDFALFVFLLPRITDCTMWTGRLLAIYRQSEVAQIGRAHV